jgi:plasmid stabilization system protein ParE
VEKQSKVTFAESAVKDLKEIKAWYADQQVPDVGEKFIKEIISRIETLADYPETGRMVPEFGITHLRELINPPCRVVYRLEQDRVRIVRVWRSERLLQLP